MTRFMITLEEGVNLFGTHLKQCVVERYIKKIPSMNIMDIAKVVDPNSKLNIGIRPGENYMSK